MENRTKISATEDLRKASTEKGKGERREEEKEIERERHRFPRGISSALIRCDTFQKAINGPSSSYVKSFNAHIKGAIEMEGALAMFLVRKIFLPPSVCLPISSHSYPALPNRGGINFSREYPASRLLCSRSP